MGNAANACCGAQRQSNTTVSSAAVRRTSEASQVFNLPRVFKQGYLFKKGGNFDESTPIDVGKENVNNKFGEWRKRYFVFDRSSVSYFEDEAAYNKKAEPKGTLPVQSDSNFSIRELPADFTTQNMSDADKQALNTEKALFFEMCTTGRNMLVRAETAAEKQAWINAFKEYVNTMQSVQSQLSGQGGNSASGGVAGLPADVQAAVAKVDEIETEFNSLDETGLVKGRGKALNTMLKDIKPVLVAAKSTYPEIMKPIIFKYNRLVTDVPAKVNLAITEYNAKRAPQSAVL